MDAGPDRAPRVLPEARALRELQAAMTDAALALAKRMQLNTTDLAALEHLSLAPGPIGPGELSGRLGITPAAGTELVNRLERAGHVDRSRDDLDRRRVHLHVSAGASREVLGELQGLLVALEAISAGFSADEREVINRYLDGIIAAYRAFAAGDQPD